MRRRPAMLVGMALAVACGRGELGPGKGDGAADASIDVPGDKGDVGDAPVDVDAPDAQGGDVAVDAAPDSGDAADADLADAMDRPVDLGADDTRDAGGDTADCHGDRKSVDAEPTMGPCLGKCGDKECWLCWKADLATWDIFCEGDSFDPSYVECSDVECDGPEDCPEGESCSRAMSEYLYRVVCSAVPPGPFPFSAALCHNNDDCPCGQFCQEPGGSEYKFARGVCRKL